MSAAGPRRVILLAAGGDVLESLLTPLLAAAHSVDTEAALRVEVLHVHGEGATASPTDSTASIWWDARHPQLQEAPPRLAWAAACTQALERMGVRDGDDALVLLAPGAFGEELAARLALLVGGTSMGRCQALAFDADGLMAHKDVFGGRAVAVLRSAAWPCFAALRPRAVVAAQPSTQLTERRSIALDAPLPARLASEPVASTDAARRLEGAAIVVSGGRGMQGPQGFEMLARLAQRLDAALGASLPAVDAGWAPVSRQVGQSGKFVLPRTYLAVGISGTPQHLAGISPETAIVAINKDADAPIFAAAHVGVVGNWEAILPALLERLEAGAPT